MPELPEVTTTVNGLKKVLPKRKILGVWTDLAKDKINRKDFEHTIKYKKFFLNFKKNVIDEKIVNVERFGKNILIHLSNKKTILIHMKMTGHLLYGKYIHKKDKNIWMPDKNENKNLHDPYNRFIHAIFILDNGKHLAFSDSRKFGKITLIDTETHKESIHLKKLGSEPLLKDFTFKEFKKTLLAKKINHNKPIKSILMDQSVIVGIGNIYSDEMLWLASINPKSHVAKLKDIQLKNLYIKMKEVLFKGIDFGGDSMSDYRNIFGERGNFQNHHNVYRKNKEKCLKKNCTGVIKREMISGRSAHFCEEHQKLYI